MTAYEKVAWDNVHEVGDSEYLDTVIERLFDLAALDENNLLKTNVLYQYISDLEEEDQEYVINYLAARGVNYEADVSVGQSDQAASDVASKESKSPLQRRRSMDSYHMLVAEIDDISLLTAEKEKELGRKIQAGALVAEILLKHQTYADVSKVDLDYFKVIVEGNDAKKQMVEANVRLVISIAKHYTYSEMPLLDLIQEGIIGLRRAAEKFDPSLGFKFSTYATRWIQQALARAIADQSNTIRIPVPVFDKRKRLLKDKGALTAKLGRDPTTAELAAETELSEDEVVKLQNLSEASTSLEMPIGEDDSVLGDMITDHNDLSPEDLLLLKERLRVLNECLGQLPERYRLVLEHRYGLLDGVPKTLDETGRAFGTTSERARQIQNAALEAISRMQDAQVLRPDLARPKLPNSKPRNPQSPAAEEPALPAIKEEPAIQAVEPAELLANLTADEANQILDNTPELTYYEQLTVNMLLGIGGDPLNPAQIGEWLGITPDRISGIYASGIEKIKNSDHLIGGQLKARVE